MRRAILLPPPEVRLKVCSTTDRLEYVKVGVGIAATLSNLLARHGVEIDSVGRVLDFACGCGRALNFMRHRVPGGNLWGCDYDEELVQWCRRNLDIGGVELNPALPPTAFPDNHFDLIYSISLFTHLDQEAQRLWLAEWKRLLKPDGLLAITLHGKKWARRQGQRLPWNGFLHRSDGPAFNQQVTFQTPRWVKRHWSSDFRILEYDELGLIEHQDIVLMTPRGSSRKSDPPLSRTIPKEMLDHARQRSDLKLLFDERGMGKRGTVWHNLSLEEWALFFGCHEAPELARFGYEALFSEEIGL